MGYFWKVAAVCKVYLESLAADALLYGGVVGKHQQALLDRPVPLSVEQVLHLAARLDLVAEHNRPRAVLRAKTLSRSVMHVFHPLPLSMLASSALPAHTNVQANSSVAKAIGTHLLLQHTQESGRFALKACLLIDDIAATAVYQLLQHTWRCAVESCARKALRLK